MSYMRDANGRRLDSIAVPAANEALVPRPVFLPRQAELVIATFAAGHGWTSNGNWSAVNLNDTSKQGWAVQVMTGTTDGAATGCNFTKVGGFTAFDPTGKHMLLFVQVDQPTRINSVQLYLSSDASSSFTNSAVWTALGDSGWLMQPGEWFPVIFTAAGATINGTGPGAAIQAMKIRVADKGGAAPLTISVGGVSQYSRATAYPNGVISLCYDDGWLTHYTAVAPKLSQYRYRASCFPILDRLGLSGYATEAQFLSLGRAYGWEIGAHASTLAIHQAGLPTLTGAPLTNELLTIRQWMTTRGLPSQTMAYPQGTYNPEVLTEARKLFAVARTTDGANIEVYPPADPIRVRSLSLTTSPAVSLATAKAFVDSVFTNGHHGVLTMHSIVPSAPTTVNWLQSDHDALIDYIASKGVPVKPLGEVLAGV